MQDLSGKTAVITGAGSGFGRELALSCAGEGMRLVLADIDMAALEGTAELVAPLGAEPLLRRVDVASQDQVDALADASFAQFGAVHLVFNNAGVAASGPLWTTTLEDWQWVMGVNVMGVVHGIRSFVPRMIAAKQPGHIVNTASAAGLVAMPNSSVYCVSKHSVVVMSECLYHELREVEAEIGVSVLCPAFVNTGIANAARNRPAELANSNPLAAESGQKMAKAVRSGKLTAADIAALTMAAVKADRFYIISHPKIKLAIEARFGDILGDRAPTNTAP